MMHILLIKSSNCRDVRLQKYINFLSINGHIISFVGWNRLYESTVYRANINNLHYIVNNFSSSTTKIILGNIIWAIKSFLWLEKNRNNFDIIYCADFEGALPLFLNNVISRRKSKYIYDIYDEFSIRYKLPPSVKKAISWIDKKIRRDATLVIHVDKSRVSELDKDAKWVILENSPIDFYANRQNARVNTRHCTPSFAVTGYLTKRRGLHSVLGFAKDNQNYHFIVAGRFKDILLLNEFKSLKNVRCHDFMPQEKLFSMIKDVNGIFSLYDPNIEINIKAASNKLYDAMMLGIPIITNKEIIAGQFVEKEGIGVTVPYVYSARTWHSSLIDVIERNNSALQMGKNGRKLFMQCYDFNEKLESILKNVTI